MSVDIVNNPFLYCETTIKAGSEKAIGPGHLPKEIQDYILDHISLAELKPRVCRKFAAVWLKKTMQELSNKSRVTKVALNSKEQENEINVFFSVLKTLPKSVVFPESVMPTIPQIKKDFNYLWSQVEPSWFSFSTNQHCAIKHINKFQEHIDGRKFLRNLPTELLFCHTTIQIQEINIRIESGESISGLFPMFAVILRGQFTDDDDLGHIFFTHISVKALAVLMQEFGTRINLAPFELEVIFKSMENQRLACEKFILIAKAAINGFREKSQNSQCNAILTLLLLGDHFNRTYFNLLPLNELRSWIPKEWLQSCHPHIMEAYPYKYSQLKQICLRLGLFF